MKCVARSVLGIFAIFCMTQVSIAADVAPAAASASASASASAVKGLDEKYFSVSSVHVQAVEERYYSEPWLGSVNDGCSASQAPGTFRRKSNAGSAPFSDSFDSIDQIVNIGKVIWMIVEKGRPVVDVKMDVGTALPLGARCWFDLQGWSRPTARTFLASFKNIYGIEVVRFKFKILSVTGGNVRGHGKYIGFATMIPEDVSVVWGFNFNVQGAVPAIMNIGTHEDPVAGMLLSMKYSVETVFQHKTMSQNYFLDGAGNFEILK